MKIDTRHHMRFNGLLVLLSWLLFTERASAQERPLVIEIGKTLETKVGYARGWSCDDPTLVTAELVTRDEQNVWIVTGQKTGSTQCRVGTDPYGVSFVFHVRVVPRRRVDKAREK